MTRIMAALLAAYITGLATARAIDTPSRQASEPLRLGNFSVSLAVKDIAASRAFYEKLGFRAIMGEQSKNWLILQNDGATIGLFQGIVPRNTLTFNPGWDRKAAAIADFDDVRVIQRALKGHGLALTMEASESTSGPGSVMLADPDGNPILIDQHVPSPKK